MDLNINDDNILFFDLDGTLVDTDYANFLSYEKAINSVTSTEYNLTYNSDKRFNRSSLKKIIPDLSHAEYEKIIQEKEEFYKHFLIETKLNETIAEILVKYSKTNKSVLVTNCREERARLTLDYYHLTDKFNYAFFLQQSNNEISKNKYQRAISDLNVEPHAIIVFENEQEEKENAFNVGIPYKNILNLNL